MKYGNIFIFAWIVLWLNNDASLNDKQAVRTGIRQMFNRPTQTKEIDYAGLPQYRAIANTNIIGRLLVINEAQLLNLGVDLSNVTVAKLNAWKDSNMENPNHLRWDRGDSWEQIVIDNGLEIVPVEEPSL